MPKIFLHFCTKQLTCAQCPAESLYNSWETTTTLVYGWMLATHIYLVSHDLCAKCVTTKAKCWRIQNGGAKRHAYAARLGWCITVIIVIPSLYVPCTCLYLNCFSMTCTWSDVWWCMYDYTFTYSQGEYVHSIYRCIQWYQSPHHGIQRSLYFLSLQLTLPAPQCNSRLSLQQNQCSTHIEILGT